MGFSSSLMACCTVPLLFGEHIGMVVSTAGLEEDIWKYADVGTVAGFMKESF